MYRIAAKIDLEREATCPLCRELITEHTWFTIHAFVICVHCGMTMLGDETDVLNRCSLHPTLVTAWSTFRGLIFFTPPPHIPRNLSANVIAGISRKQRHTIG